MSNHICEIAHFAAKLRVKNSLLVIDGQQQATVPLHELAVLLLSNPQVSLTQPVLSRICESGGVVITCDARRQPIGMLLPIIAHHAQVSRFVLQAESKPTLRKRLWQQVVRGKIASQASALEHLHESSHGLRNLIPQVKSGDPANVEARTARRYWSLLFAKPSFRRDRDAPDQNRWLNYGYAVLCAVVARAICAAGLHPSLGIHHHNKYAGFPLADDLMEPLRPIVDIAAAQMLAEEFSFDPFDHSWKPRVIDALTGTLEMHSEQRSLFDASARIAYSLAAAFEGNVSKLVFPSIQP